MGALVAISYLVLCFIVASLLTAFLSIFRPISAQDHFLPWRWTVAFTLILAVSPYLYMKTLTDRYGADVSADVKTMVHEAGVKGDLAYFVITNSDEKRMRVLAVANEKTSIRFNDRVIMEINFERDARQRWKIEDYEILSSFDRSRDKVVVPPIM